MLAQRKSYIFPASLVYTGIIDDADDSGVYVCFLYYYLKFYSSIFEKCIHVYSDI